MEIETTDATELPQEKKEELVSSMLGTDEGGLGHVEGLKQDAILGTFDDTPRSFTTEYHGDCVEAALGRVYAIRDTIEDNTDARVSAEPTGKAWNFPSTTFYEIEVTINGGNDE